MRLGTSFAACVVGFAALALSACGAGSEGAGVDPDTAVSSPAPSGGPAPPDPGVALSQEPGADACQAEARADWVGRQRSQLPAPSSDETWRVYETGDALTEDYRVSRLNIEIDPRSHKVLRLWCG